MKIDSLTSVKKGTQVKVKGYVIGRVIDLIPVYKPDLHFLAKMRIGKEISLYEDCAAIIQNQNVIGDSSIELRNPERKGNPLLDQDIIEGIEYVNLERILQDVHVLLTNLTQTVNVFKSISQDSRHNIRIFVANLSKSVANINKILFDSQKDISTILRSFRKTAKTMNEISKELKKHPVKFLFKGKK